MQTNNFGTKQMRHSEVYFAALLLSVSAQSHAQTARGHMQLVAKTSTQATQASVGCPVNVLALGGSIAISDGNVHTVGTAPAGSMFYGINSLASLAALTINGTTPFSFLRSSGSVILLRQEPATAVAALLPLYGRTDRRSDSSRPT